MRAPHFPLWRQTLLLLLAAYLLFCLGMTLNQRRFIYLPFSGPTTPQEAGLKNFSSKELTDSTGHKIVYWESSANPKAPLVFYFHGNGGGLHQFLPNLRYLQQQGFHVVAMEYRGYPGAPAGPSETAIIEDGLQLIDAFRIHHPNKKRAYWGYSLGTGIASQLAARLPPNALVLEAPFTSIADRAAELYPYLPARLLVRDRYLSREALKTMHAPLLILHGDQDRIIPLHHAQALYSAANAPRELRIYKGFGHLDLQKSTAYDDASRFLRQAMKN